MGGGARAGDGECVLHSVEHVRLVVGAVEVLAIPASWKNVSKLDRVRRIYWN